MSRLFTTNEVRSVTELDGIWDFVAVPNGNVDLKALQYTHRLPVPGCWEMHPDFLTYRGQAVYRRFITVASETSLRFIFKGISHTGTIFFNGTKIAEHYNAYTAFEAIVKRVEPGTHELAILVDNSFSEASSLHVANDYYTYGGLIRPVMMEEISDVFIERIAFNPIQESAYEPGSWNADIRVTVRRHAAVDTTTEAVELRYYVKGYTAGQSIEFGSITVAPGESVVVGGVYEFPQAQSWSPSNPVLYELQTQLYAEHGASPVDDLIERVGFRTVTAVHGKIQVNGEDVILKGFNRHEDHPIVGAAFPVALMAHDLDLMIDMGSNAVRTSHYPNDERFLDLCDEQGILVWEENHARGLSIEQMRNPNFIWQCEQVNREMVEQHYNHPSIIIWAILNECASDLEEGREHYKRQLEQIRELDSSRPLTFASHHRDKEICFDLADIVSCNLYPGWYGDEDPGELCDQARGWADASGGAGKPMIMSEFGGDGHYGHRDPSRVRGTEERQADIIEANLKAYTTREYMSGMFIWQFCDCRVTEGTGWLLARAGTQNSKGIVDRYRRPKLAYSVVKRYYQEHQ